MKYVLCTSEDWISRGRLDHTIRDDRDDEGQELFISMEGVSYREPEVIAKKIITHVRKFIVLSAGPQQYDYRESSF